MTREQINVLIIKNQERLKSIARRYCKEGDFDDFYQLLLIEVWSMLEEKFNGSRNDDPEGFLFSPKIINQLAVNAWRSLYAGKENLFYNSMVSVDGNEIIEEVNPIDIYTLTKLNEDEQWFLGLVLDRLACRTPQYIIAQDMNITLDQFKYKIKKIKSKIRGKSKHQN